MEMQQHCLVPKHYCKVVQGNKTKYPWASMRVGDSFLLMVIPIKSKPY